MSLFWVFCALILPTISSAFPDELACDACVGLDQNSCDNKKGCAWSTAQGLCGNGCLYEAEESCGIEASQAGCYRECRWLGGVLQACIIKWDFHFDVCFVVDASESISDVEWLAIRQLFIKGVIEAITPLSCDLADPEIASQFCPGVGIVQFDYIAETIIPPLGDQQCFLPSTTLGPLPTNWKSIVDQMILSKHRDGPGGGTFTVLGVQRCVDLLYNTRMASRKSLSLLILMTDSNPNGPVVCEGDVCSVCGMNPDKDRAIHVWPTAECGPQPGRVNFTERRQDDKMREAGIKSFLVLFKENVNAWKNEDKLMCLVNITNPTYQILSVEKSMLADFADGSTRKAAVGRMIGDIGNLVCEFLTLAPTVSPTISPSLSPTRDPTESPTNEPTDSPTISPTRAPTSSPSNKPSENPSEIPTDSPTNSPSESPSMDPSKSPSETPTTNPTDSPTASPSEHPTTEPTSSPSETPSDSPSDSPSELPTKSPTGSPTRSPSKTPTSAPSESPSQEPTECPSENPTESPSVSPSESPSNRPSKDPTSEPSESPTTSPSRSPSESPSSSPTFAPSACHGPPPDFPPKGKNVCRDDCSGIITVKPVPHVEVHVEERTTILCYEYRLLGGTTCTNPGNVLRASFVMDECCPDERMDFIEDVSFGSVVHDGSDCPIVPVESDPFGAVCTRYQRQCSSANAFCSVLNMNDLDEDDTVGEFCVTVSGIDYDAQPMIDGTLDQTDVAKLCIERDSPDSEDKDYCSCVPIDFIPSRKICSRTANPTESPTASPTNSPTTNPSTDPSQSPTSEPTNDPSECPTEPPTQSPSDVPSKSPTTLPTDSPTEKPSKSPTEQPTQSPTQSPTGSPSDSPSNSPSKRPTGTPTTEPTDEPTTTPTTSPSESPTTKPSSAPTQPYCPNKSLPEDVEDGSCRVKCEAGQAVEWSVKLEEYAHDAECNTTLFKYCVSMDRDYYTKPNACLYPLGNKQHGRDVSHFHLRLDECCPACLSLSHFSQPTLPISVVNPDEGSPYFKIDVGKECYEFSMGGRIGLATGKWCIKGSTKCFCDTIQVPASCNIKDQGILCPPKEEKNPTWRGPLPTEDPTSRPTKRPTRWSRTQRRSRRSRRRSGRRSGRTWQ